MSLRRPDIVYINKVWKFDPIRKRMKLWKVHYSQIAFILTLWDLDAKNMRGGILYCLNQWNKKFPRKQLTYKKMCYLIYQWENFRTKMDKKYGVK